MSVDLRVASSDLCLIVFQKNIRKKIKSKKKKKKRYANFIPANTNDYPYFKIIC